MERNSLNSRDLRKTTNNPTVMMEGDKDETSPQATKQQRHHLYSYDDRDVISTKKKKKIITIPKQTSQRFTLGQKACLSQEM